MELNAEEDDIMLKGFIRKVYGILASMYLTTFIWTLLVVQSCKLPEITEDGSDEAPQGSDEDDEEV